MPNRGNAVEKEAAVVSTSLDKYPPIKAGLHRGADSLDLDSLIRNIPDAQLRFAIAREVAKLRTNKKFGLVFEEHAPEVVQLPNFPVQVGATVVKRGDRKNEIFRVNGPAGGSKFRITRDLGGAEETVSAKELVVIKKFGEPIYPTLTSIDRVTRGHDKPYHTIINADNFHALQLLLYCYAGQVDVIYIDPPYNTGARDWKYNNNYVDKNDQFRHSKWLSMMKKRLLLAKQLLKPKGVLIVTIDDWETHHLQVLMEELFPNRELTNVVIQNNPKGSPSNNFTYSHEYAHFLIPKGLALVGTDPTTKEDTRNLRRAGKASLRVDRPTMFYPIYVANAKITRIGECPADSFHPISRNMMSNTGEIEVWPIDDEGRERRWHFGLDSICDELSRIEVRTNASGEVQLYVQATESRYKTVWIGGELDAGKYGTTLVKDIIEEEFPFPKSVYAVKKCLETVARSRTGALILDFFAGSGTTLHATALMNADDGGRRRCILVTNNEVGEKLAKQLYKRGYWSGDQEYEKHGICESVTWPRCKYAVNGKRDDGTELPGTYLTGRAIKGGFAENVEYFKLDFLDPHEVAYGEKFEAILPILWLMAGAQGERDKAARGYGKWFIPESSPYAVLIKEDHFAEFNRRIKQRRDITHVFLVTDSEEAFREMIAELPNSLKTKMLYKSYLNNFRINTGKNL